MGIDADGKKYILGIWISETESASFWTVAFNELKNRGVKDILIWFRLYCLTVIQRAFLQHIADKYPNDYIPMCVDGASYHKSKDLIAPENIELYPLLAHTLE